MILRSRRKEEPITHPETASKLNKARRKKSPWFVVEGELAEDFKKVLSFQNISKEEADTLDTSWTPRLTVKKVTGTSVTVQDIVFIIKLKGFTGLHKLFTAYHIDVTEQESAPVITFTRK
ncbi:hypothetical protein [Sinobaca sp. H24]|uniref:hypothetical protein n=1 Tax=Sinobaca sp. H24 TaxID=2923376 RepID=UPI00207A3BCD|nr:hypothetical protein [Sinobaca sp. H24]